MFFEDKKEDEVAVQSLQKLKEDIFLKLSHFTDTDIKQISQLSKHFFSQVFSIKGKTTFEEIRHEIEEKKISLQTKEKIYKYLEELTEAEYSEIELGKVRDKKLISLFKQAVEAIVDDHSKKNRLLSEKAIIQDIIHPSNILNIFEARKKEKEEIEKDSEIIQIFDIIKKTRESLDENKPQEAKLLYSQLMDEYSKLPIHSKKQVYFHITKLYEKFGHKNK